MALKQAKSLVEIPLQQVDARLAEIVASINDPATQRWIAYFSDRSGHRLRPLLAFLIYYGLKPFSGPATKELVDLATSLELIHSASLVHDDVIDEESNRRGQTALQKLTGNRGAVLLGNIFYLKAFDIAHVLPLPELFSDMTRTASEMCFGEVIQSENRGHLLNQTDYLKIVTYKTAALVALTCRSAARLAGAVADTVQQIERLGLILGILYQLRDDLKDHDIALRTDVNVRQVANDLHHEFGHLLSSLALDPAAADSLAALELLISQDFLADQ
ncbi:MAG: polyprenyl synthetase family protein [Eubacteriales bacterium]|nr:polyprenyl synthetase family protein [Eubacteriales bacterium]